MVYYRNLLILIRVSLCQNIGDNIRLMLDIIDYAYCKKVPEAVLFLGLCKAFDSLKWPFIFEMLKLCGFGSKIINWIKILTYIKNLNAELSMIIISVIF